MLALACFPACFIHSLCSGCRWKRQKYRLQRAKKRERKEKKLAKSDCVSESERALQAVLCRSADWRLTWWSLSLPREHCRVESTEKRRERLERRWENWWQWTMVTAAVAAENKRTLGRCCTPLIAQHTVIMQMQWQWKRSQSSLSYQCNCCFTDFLC